MYDWVCGRAEPDSDSGNKSREDNDPEDNVDPPHPVNGDSHGVHSSTSTPAPPHAMAGGGEPPPEDKDNLSASDADVFEKQSAG